MAKQSQAKAAESELIDELEHGHTSEPPFEAIQEREEQERAAEVNEPQPETPAPATVRAKVKPFEFDQVSGVVTINDRHGTFQCSLMGINPKVEWVLAAHGLNALLKGRVNKERVLENMKAGQFGGKKRKKYPATVVAYANLHVITTEEAFEQWQRLSNAEKAEIRSLPQIRLELARMAGGDKPL